MFFALLRGSLAAGGSVCAGGSGKAASGGLRGEDVTGQLGRLTRRQWGRLFRMAAQQNVGGIVYQELVRLGETLPGSLKELGVPEDIAGQWSKWAEYGRGKFDAQLMALTHLAQVLAEEGVRVMVLKGVGLSLLYPCPQMRECSDVDIYCFGEYERVNALLLRRGLIAGIDEQNDKHCAFTFDGISIENHRYFSEYVNRANVVVGREIVRLCEEGTAHLGTPAEPGGTAHLGTLAEPGGTALLTDPRLPGIYFPSPKMGVHHLMMHTLSHLAWSGITVRHLIDCGLYLGRYLEGVLADSDREEILSLWRDAGIAGGALRICKICEDVLGLRTGMIPEKLAGGKVAGGKVSQGEENPEKLAGGKVSQGELAAGAINSVGWDEKMRDEAEWDRIFSDSALILNAILDPIPNSSQTWNPAAKLWRKVRWFRRRRALHPIVYGEAFPDSFLKSFAFLRSRSRKGDGTLKADFE